LRTLSFFFFFLDRRCAYGRPSDFTLCFFSPSGKGQRKPGVGRRFLFFFFPPLSPNRLSGLCRTFQVCGSFFFFFPGGDEKKWTFEFRQSIFFSSPFLFSSPCLANDEPKSVFPGVRKGCFSLPSRSAHRCHVAPEPSPFSPLRETVLILYSIRFLSHSKQQPGEIVLLFSLFFFPGLWPVRRPAKTFCGLEPKSRFFSFSFAV